MNQKNAFLADRSIEALMKGGHVTAPGPMLDVEPASIDLRPIGTQSLVPVSFLPVRTESVEDTAASLRIAEVPLATRIMPRTPYVTIVRLGIDLDLPPDVKAVFSPKSSIGRLDLQVRVMADRSDRYDETPFGYKGAIYAEIVSWSFPIEIAGPDAPYGEPLTQIRFVRSADPDRYKTTDTLLRTQTLSIGMEGREVGWIADQADPGHVIRLGRSRDLPIENHWRPLLRNDRGVVLRRDAFYIAGSAEPITVQNDECAILRQIDMTLSQAAWHAAGFVDCGFGLAERSIMVYEIRNNGPDMLVREGQPVAILETHRLDRPAMRPYGQGRVSYQGQGVRLARCFRQP